MKKFYLILLFLIYNSFLFSQKKSPNIYSEIIDSSYNFENLGATFNTINILFNVGLTPYHVGSFGFFDLETGEKMVERVLEDTLVQGLGNISIAQAFNKYNDGTFSVWTIEKEMPGYHIFDDSLNQILILDNIGVFADQHGIAKLSDERYAYFSSANDTMLTFPPDTNLMDVSSFNVNIFNPADSSDFILFDWYANIPNTLFIQDYALEGDFGDDIIEWGHPNSIFEDFDGHLLVSWRSLGVCKINVSSGEIIWWAGLPENLASQHGFDELSCTEGDCRLRLQHDLKPIKGKPGEYTVFDNGDSIRSESRALFFEVDEENLTMSVIKESFFVPSDLMGSVDVLENGSYLVNVVDINGIPQEQIPSWVQSGYLMDSIGSYIHLLGSKVYLYDAEDNLVARYWTDSANVIYNSFFVELNNWPALNCNEEEIFVENIPDDFSWINESNTGLDNDTWLNGHF